MNKGLALIFGFLCLLIGIYIGYNCGFDAGKDDCIDTPFDRTYTEAEVDSIKRAKYRQGVHYGFMMGAAQVNEFTTLPYLLTPGRTHREIEILKGIDEAIVKTNTALEDSAKTYQ